jgi:hypothetical protein
MKYLSLFIAQIKGLYLKAWIRFPEVLLTSFSVAITAWIIDNTSQASSLAFFDPIIKTINVLWLLLPALLFNALLFERFSSWKQWRWPMVGVWTLLAIVYWFIVETDVIPNVVSLRYSFMQVSFLLLAITMPYFFKRTNFAHYFVDVLSRLLQSVLYSFVLYTGVSIIYLAITILFQVDLNPFFFTSLYFGVFSFVFTPYFLGIIPLQDKTYEQDYSSIWKTLFATVLLPLVSAFSVILIVFLIQNLVSPDVFAIQFYVISSLLVGYVGLIVIAILKPLKNKPFYFAWFENYFPYLALIFMAGFYYLIILSGLQLFWSPPLFVNAFLGLWVVINSVFSIIKKWNQLQMLALSAVDLLLLATIVPGINVIDISTEIYKQEFVAILERNDMIDETTNTIIPQPGGLADNEEETRLKDLVSEMAFLGYHRFPYFPKDFQDNEFLSVFGFLPDGDDGEDNVILINYSFESVNFIDLTLFDHTTLLYMSNLPFESFTTQGWTLDYDPDTTILNLDQLAGESLVINMGEVAIDIYQAMEEVNSNLSISDLSKLTVQLDDCTVYGLSFLARYDVLQNRIIDVNGVFIIGID